VAVLEEVGREFDQLDIFRKMYAGRDFQHKAGMSIDDCLEVVSDLAPELEILEKAMEAGETTKTNQMRGKLIWLTGNLTELADYFEKTRQDARSFIRDPEALEALNHRERVVRSLISVLKSSLTRQKGEILTIDNEAPAPLLARFRRSSWPNLRPSRMTWRRHAAYGRSADAGKIIKKDPRGVVELVDQLEPLEWCASSQPVVPGLARPAVLQLSARCYRRHPTITVTADWALQPCP
jgi:hypothetical protein